MTGKSASATAWPLACLAAVLSASSAHAAEKACGILQGQAREIDESPRFQLLSTGDAFIDLRTCLVWSLRPSADRKPLNEAMQDCASLGYERGESGVMGWQLPTAAELTSLNGEEWDRQRQELQQYHLPPLDRSETPFWTSSPWLGRPDSWAVVTFDVRTVMLVRPVEPDQKAGVWCVRGVPARGLRTP